MEYHGLYRVVRRPGESLEPAGGDFWRIVWKGRFSEVSRGQIIELTGLSPEELAVPGWRCFWQETPRR